MPGSKLTPKKLRFVEEYMVDCNATAAAIRVGYSERSAKKTGFQLLRDARVTELVQQRQAALAKKLRVTVEDVIGAYKAIAFGDLGDCIEADEKGVRLIKPLSQLTPEQRAMISEISNVYGSDGRCGVRVKLHPRLVALQDLAKHLGMFTERHEHAVSVSGDAKVQFYLPSNGRRPGE
jgi:phage terminase small subunit